MEQNKSDETGSSGEAGDPTFVPMMRPMVVINSSMIPPIDERRDDTGDLCSSDESIPEFNETIKPRRNPERGAVNKNNNENTNKNINLPDKKRGDMEDVCSSDESILEINRAIKKRRNPERVSVTKNKKTIMSTDSERENAAFPENHEAEKVYKAMSAPELGAYESLKKAEEVNIKSKNLKGGLKGQLRDAVADLREIFRAMILKINAKGDIEFLRADIAREVAKNIELNIEMEKIKGDNEVLNIRINDRDNSIKSMTCKGCTRGLNYHTEENTRESDGRKRRRVQEISPTANSTIKDNVDMEIERINKMEDGFAAELERCKEEARFCHSETKKVARDVKRLLAESETEGSTFDGIEERRNKKKVKTETMTEIYKLIGNYLNKDKKSKENKPRIIENIKAPFVFGLQRYRPGDPLPSTSRAGNDEQTPWSDTADNLKENRYVNNVNNVNTVQDNARPVQPDRVILQNHEIRERDIQRLKHTRQRNLKTAAITITCEEDVSYNEIITRAKREITLTEYGIEDCKTRRGYTGGLVMEISGEEAADKADKLAIKLREVLKNERVNIQRPVKKVNIKITGFDETTDKEEITNEIIRICECRHEDIRVSNVRRTIRGIGIAWLVCTIEVAINLLEKNKIRIGWSMVRCEIASARPLRCYRCMETGHSRFNCRSSIDRSGNCFNCGKLGHTANGCTNRSSCMVCRYYGKPHAHRTGGPGCGPVTTEDRRNLRDRRPEENSHNENR